MGKTFRKAKTSNKNYQFKEHKNPMAKPVQSIKLPGSPSMRSERDTSRTSIRTGVPPIGTMGRVTTRPIEEITLDNAQNDQEVKLALGVINKSMNKIKEAQKTKKYKTWTAEDADYTLPIDPSKQTAEFSDVSEEEEMPAKMNSLSEQSLGSTRSSGWKDFPTKDMPVVAPSGEKSVHKSLQSMSLNKSESTRASGWKDFPTKTMPVVSPSGAKPASSSFGARPASSSFGAKPASSSFGAKPASSSFGARPASSSFGAKPVDRSLQSTGRQPLFSKTEKQQAREKIKKELLGYAEKDSENPTLRKMLTTPAHLRHGRRQYAAAPLSKTRSEQLPPKKFGEQAQNRMQSTDKSKPQQTYKSKDVTGYSKVDPNTNSRATYFSILKTPLSSQQINSCPSGARSQQTNGFPSGARTQNAKAKKAIPAENVRPAQKESQALANMARTNLLPLVGPQITESHNGALRVQRTQHAYVVNKVFKSKTSSKNDPFLKRVHHNVKNRAGMNEYAKESKYSSTYKQPIFEDDQ
ncbi:uncharacterized protein NESG_00541 [Nematocida ausubeli]|uniref:Uncharacterized protein n=1 Tax=Nematocida ausubeli (strain ATCC PRA-371 / ERTm2) TaxID=1913371 RepID=A0A086J5P4_NEMA1|nr:uncharacterized protein NESG_00541 [Nematocida ausubeli]KAI5134222.1 hypothetical protein NEAUS07_0754 [Nematocida ausubeli]KAI5135455.1 hypothetical protein NEAUS07_1170 [Nematocida ausubeli]KAI5148593.1 hypothetical protein NEAUS05_1447 [Nematocida ausubeli]KFG27462.1 hypothetical protein NESG_00541 [Nematocida ausubeli]